MSMRYNHPPLFDTCRHCRNMRRLKKSTYLCASCTRLDRVLLWQEITGVNVPFRVVCRDNTIPADSPHQTFDVARCRTFEDARRAARTRYSRLTPREHAGLSFFVAQDDGVVLFETESCPKPSMQYALA